MIAFAILVSKRPSSLFTRAAARLIWTVASTYAGFGLNPLIGKFPNALIVWIP